ncbi:MAG: outer membrane beta-barrel protein [Parafilimonas sp.]
MRAFIVSIIILLPTSAMAQSSIIHGRVYDSIAKQPLAYTTLNLLHTDSTLVTFSRADEQGYFSFTGIRQGSYLISTSYVGYVPLWQEIIIDDTLNNINLYMQELLHADTVVVHTKRPPVVINKDTIEFNTENFKTMPNAVVEDMLKRMPGVTVEDDGSITVNGEKIKRLLVNGKEFFTGDVKAATKNLPADAVDKVQVYNRQSDQSQFTGIDDGNSEKTINLKLKKDKDHALFGKLMAGAGNKEHYDAQANINKLNGDEQLSLLGMSNDINKQGFEITDVLNFTGELSKGVRNGRGMVIKTSKGQDNDGLPVTGLGQKQQGVATTTAGGINYNNLWNEGKTDWSSNYMGSNIRLITSKEVEAQSVTPSNLFTNYQTEEVVTANTQHRVNLSVDQKFDSSSSLKITPVVTFQQTNKQTNAAYSALDNSGSKLNEGFSNINTGADAFNISSTLLFRKQLNKPGRTFSVNAALTYNNSSLHGDIVSENKLYNPDGIATDSLVNQQYDKDANTINIGSNITYTEPVGKRSLFEFSGYFNTNMGNSRKQTHDFNNSSDKYDAFNSALSNDFKNNYTYTGGGVNFRTNPGKLNITAGTQLQSANLKTIDNTHQQTTQRNFTDLLPSVILQYNISNIKNLRFEYSTSTTQPSTTQLQPVADVSDPLHIITGNPNLKREYQQQISIHFFAGNPLMRKSLLGLLNFSTVNNAIVNADNIMENATSTRTYTNANGVYSLAGHFVYGFPVKKSASRIETGAFIKFNNDISFINAQRNVIRDFSVGPNISYHFDKDDIINIDVSAKATINSTKYSAQRAANAMYYQQVYGINIINYLPGNIHLQNDFNYNIYTGRSDGFNTGIALWNVTIGKSFLKNNRGELKFSVQDLLNNNTGINRYTNNGFITDERYNALKRYFLISFTFSLNKSGLKNNGPRAVIRNFNN